MNQPELGIKVSELRQQLGLTQEQLAEECDVSARTIQRIESGDVEPRAFTRNNLGNVLQFDFGEPNCKHEALWLAVLHLSNAFLMLIIPLLIWSLKKGQSLKIDRHGRDVLNFQITMTLLLIGATLFLLVVPPTLLILQGSTNGGIQIWAVILASVSVMPLILIGVYCSVVAIINTLRVLSDKPYRYPLAIPFIKA